MSTKTTRRTAKITKPLTDIALARVYDKATGVCIGYLAQPSKPLHADGSIKAWYQVTCSERGEWSCTCPATTTSCKHIEAVKADCAERVAAGKPGCFQGVVKEVEAPAIEQRIHRIATDWFWVQWRSAGERDWQNYRDSNGSAISLPESYATRFIAVDSDEHRNAVRVAWATEHAAQWRTAEPSEVVTQNREYAMRSMARIQNGEDHVVPRSMSSTEADLHRREHAPLNGNRAFSLMR